MATAIPVWMDCLSDDSTNSRKADDGGIAYTDASETVTPLERKESTAKPEGAELPVAGRTRMDPVTVDAPVFMVLRDQKLFGEM